MTTPPRASADIWLLSRMARVTPYATSELQTGEYTTSRAEVERFF